MADQPTGASVSITDLSHTYDGPDGPLKVIDNVAFDVPSGGYMALTGPSGAGKSTLLSLLGGLEVPQAGSLRVGSLDLASMKRNQLAHYRSHIVGFVFQHFGLLDSLTALENIELACTLNGTPPRARHDRSVELLNAVGLSHRKDHRPLHLSGGERQRVAIARALANNPQLILADEPTGNLDEQTAEVVISLLEQVVQDRGTTLIVVTHNHELAARAQQRIVLEAGHVV